VRRHISSYGLWAVWLASRAVLFSLVTAPGMIDDVGLYQRWYTCCLSRHVFPAGDPLWQYPPGAGVVFWLAGHLPGRYTDSFTLLAIGCDLAVTLLLCAAPRRGGSLAGAWYWVCAVPVPGTITIGRLDIIPVAISVAAASVTKRGGVRGLLIGAGAAVKAWPVTLLAGAAPGQRRRVLAAAAAVLAATCVAFRGPTMSFLAHQGAREVEIESVAATPFLIWRHAGWHGAVVYRYGAMQLSGEDVTIALDASRLCLVLIAAAVAVWSLWVGRDRGRWRPEFAADAPLAVTLLVLVASPLLSVQYVLWVIGLAAACLANRGTTQRPVALILLAVAGLTVAIYPAMWHPLLEGSGAVTGVLMTRNALLVAAAAVSCRRILGYRAPPRPGNSPGAGGVATVRRGRGVSLQASGSLRSRVSAETAAAAAIAAAARNAAAGDRLST